MKILYVSHRYHTNQVHIMKGWHDRNVEVMFLAQYEGVSEIHDYVTFCRMKPSLVTRILNYYIDKRYNASLGEGKKTSLFIPNMWHILSLLRKFSPDVVILRDYTIYNMMINAACKLLHINKVIMYSQIPLYGYKAHRHLADKLAKRLFPKVCFTPVLYKGMVRGKTFHSTGWFAPSWYVPLVCDISGTMNKNYCSDGFIHMVDIGKYRDYKNHFFLVDAISKLKDVSKIRLTIIGQLSQDAEREYFRSLQRYILDRKLQNVIELHSNIPFKEMQSIYSQADVLILPSKNESAGMVILEAMAQGLCVMSSEECGLAYCLDEYDCGYVFNLNTVEQLVSQLNEIINKPYMVEKYGRKSQDIVHNYFSFSNYYNELEKLIRYNYGYEFEK